MINKIAEIEALGYKARFINLKVLDVIKRDIESKHESGIIDDTLFQRYLADLSYKAPEDLPHAKSILVIAVPRPQIKADFQYNGGVKALIVPPTYTDYRVTVNRILESLSGLFSKNGYQLVKTSLPEKSLAVRSGLAYYGRSNITFIPGFGSFYQIVSYFTTVPADENDPKEPQMLPRCHSCIACANVCPTKAISLDRFMIHAEQCLTFLNENDEDFPDWIKPQFHNSLVGCMICQKCCPENKKFRDWTEHRCSFSAKETNLILNASCLEDLSQDTINKLNLLDIVGTHSAFKSIQRNIKVLL